MPSISLTNSFQTELKPYTGKDYSKLAFIFPGQGNIVPSSNADFFDIAIIKEVFQEADDLASAIGLPPLSGLIFNDLTKSDLQQKEDQSSHLALLKNLFQLTMSTALFRFLVSEGKVPNILSSHSFGEFAALHCSGVLDFPTTFNIVRQREICSPSPNEIGTLIACSVNTNEFKKLNLTAEHYIANINSPKQTVIAVPMKTLKGILKFLRSSRIGAKELKSVARPYHSPLMSPYSIKFVDALQNIPIEINPFQFDLLSSVDGRHYERGFKMSTSQLIQHLADQFTTQVHFMNQLDYLQRLGTFGFLELSALPTIKYFSDEYFDAHQGETFSTYFGDYARQGRGKTNTKRNSFTFKDKVLLSKVTQFVAKVTGYSIEEISVDQRFEDDLRIDSIKKAEILFHTLEDSQLKGETNFELSNIRYVGDLVEYIEKRKSQGDLVEQERSLKFEVTQMEWSKDLINPPQGEGSQINYSLVNIEDIFNNVEISQPNIVVHLNSSHKTNILDTADSLYKLIKNITTKYTNPQILLTAYNDSPLINALYSFILCLRKEDLDFSAKCLISDKEIDEEWVQNELSNPLSTASYYFNGQRHIQKFKNINAHTNNPISGIKILAIGGSKGILKHYFSSSKNLENSELIFSGRSKSSDNHVEEATNKFLSLFSKVDYISCDITDPKQVQQLAQACKDKDFKPDIIIDGSGREVSKKYIDKKSEDIRLEFDSKILGLKNILEFFPGQKVLQFNSISSRYGNGGQSIYSLADGWSIKQPASHIVWPALNRIGMTENLGILQKLLSMGVDLLPKEEVTQFLDVILLKTINSEGNNTFDIISLKDRLILQLQNLDQTTLSQNFGKIELSPQLRFVKTLDRNTMPFLNDHIISGKCIAPGCIGLSSMYSVAKIYFGLTPQIEDFSLKSLIPLEGAPVETYVNVNPQSISEMILSVSSRIENYSGRFLQPIKQIGETIPKDFQFLYDMDMTDFYSTNYVYHGPTFKVLQNVQITEDGRCVSTHDYNSDHPMSELTDADRMAKITESVFQTAGFLATWHDFISLVPTYFKRMTPYPTQLTEKLIITTSPLRKLQNPERWVTDVCVYNTKHKLCYKFEDVTGMKIKKYAKFPVEHKKINKDTSQWIVIP